MANSSAPATGYRSVPDDWPAHMLLAPLYIRRALGIWIVCRLAAAMMASLAGGDIVRLPLLSTLLLVSVCVALCLLDVARNRERALLANFGLSRSMVGVWSAATVIAAEAAVVALAGLAR